MGDDGRYEAFTGGTLLVLIGTVVNLGLSFGFRTVLARLLGVDQYGIIALGFTTASLTLIVASAGLPRGVARELPRVGEGEARNVALSGLALATGLGFLVGSALWLAAPLVATEVYADERLVLVIRVFAVMVPLEVLTQQIVAVFRGQERVTERVVVVNLIAPISRFVLVSLVVVLGYGVLAAAVAWVASTAVTAVAAIGVLSHRSELLSLSSYDGRYQSLLGFSLPLMLSSVMWTVIQQADNILLGAFLRTESVGLYDASFLLAKLVLTTLGAFGFLFMPMFSRLDADGDADGMDELYRTSTKWVVSLTLPIFLVLLLFPEAILGGLFGPEYAAGATALQILTLGFFVHALSGLAGNAIVSIGRTRTILLANVCVALLNVTGNVLLIPRIGIEGAAVASALSYLALNAGYLWVLRGYGISPLSRELSGSVATTAVLVVPPCLLLQYTSGVTFGMATAVFVAVLGTHGIVYLLVGASSADLEIIEAAERRTNLNLTILKQVVGD